MISGSNMREGKIMIKRSGSIVVLLLGLLLQQEGCMESKEVTRRSELNDPQETGTIWVLTKDSTLYVLSKYTLRDSFLIGVGYAERQGTQRDFSGELSLSSIQYIQSRSYSFGKTLVTIGVIGFVGSTAASYLKGNTDFSVKEKVGRYYPGGSGGGGGSCPFIYGWNGKQYVLEGEVFGVALGKALELRTLTILPSVRVDNSRVKVCISNERPETHYFNSVDLHAAEIDSAATAIADVNNVIWPVYHPMPAFAASDLSGRTILEKVRTRDQLYWESDLSSITSDFKDVVELSFSKPSSVHEGSLIVQAINTNLSQVVFKYLFDFLGDQSLAFMYAVEHDPEMIAIMRHWIEESSLKAFVWNGESWERIGMIYPEANVAPFSRVIRFKTDKIKGDTVRIQLRSLTDVWKLDAVNVDWTPVQPLKTREAPLLSAVGPGKRDVSAALSKADSQYVVVLPPEQIELTFRSVPPSPGKKITYALNAQGYLYEWFPEQKQEGRVALAGLIPGAGKIAYLKTLLKVKSLFLPPIYSEWRQAKLVNPRTAGD
jgi:hypothetical protein